MVKTRIKYATEFSLLEYNAQSDLENVFLGERVYVVFEQIRYIAVVPVVEMTPNGVEETLLVC